MSNNARLRALRELFVRTAAHDNLRAATCRGEALATKTWSSTAPAKEFEPYIDSEKGVAEFTLRAIVAGIIAGLFFGAVTVYVGLRAGLTVSASIPIAVLSISILRAFGKVTILENPLPGVV